MSISIRPAVTGDLPRITAIYAHAVTNGTASYELEPPSGEEMAARFEALRKGGFPYIIAENSEGIVGYAYAGPFRPRRASRSLPMPRPCASGAR